MVFSSIMFLFIFLPMALILIYSAPKKTRNAVLFALSLVFYSWGEVRYIFVMLASVLVDYTVSNMMVKTQRTATQRTVLLMTSVVFNLGMLIFFKYTGFFTHNVNTLLGLSLPVLEYTLPLGISFYTFQTMSYTIDVYKGRVEAERNIITFGAYVALFPQLIAGPIVKYRTIREELQQPQLSLKKFETGVLFFIAGLASKVLIANNIGLMWDEISVLESLGMATAWLGLIAFALQIYFDFSGYSYMAIGLGHMLGFSFPENFNFPYVSRSMREFWSRWHMTLGAWFKEYVYVPLGGNRAGRLRFVRNVFIVWFLTGFWHGANYNFVLWGLYFFVLLMVEKFIIGRALTQHRVLSHLYFIVFILLGWAVFAIEDLSHLAFYLRTLFSFQAGEEVWYYLGQYGSVMVLGFVFSTPWISRYFKEPKRKPLLVVCLLVLFVLSVAYLVDSSYNPFLYFRF